MGEMAAREENKVHVPPHPLAHRLDSMPTLVPRSGLDPSSWCRIIQKKPKTTNTTAVLTRIAGALGIARRGLSGR